MKIDEAVLFSGGLDSCAVLGHLFTRNEPKKHILCLAYDYGQIGFKREFAAGKKFIAALRKTKSSKKITLKKVTLDIYKTSLDQLDIHTPNGPEKEGAISAGAPLPYRNILLTTHALAMCEILEVPKLYVGYGYQSEGEGVRPMWDSHSDISVHMARLVDLKREVIDAYGYMPDSNNPTPTRLIPKLMFEVKPAYILYVEGELQALTPPVSLKLSRSCARNTVKPCGVCKQCLQREEIF